MENKQESKREVKTYEMSIDQLKSFVAVMNGLSSKLAMVDDDAIKRMEVALRVILPESAMELAATQVIDLVPRDCKDKNKVDEAYKMVEKRRKEAEIDLEKLTPEEIQDKYTKQRGNLNKK